MRNSPLAFLGRSTSATTTRTTSPARLHLSQWSRCPENRADLRWDATAPSPIITPHTCLKAECGAMTNGTHEPWKCHSPTSWSLISRWRSLASCWPVSSSTRSSSCSLRTYGDVAKTKSPLRIAGGGKWTCCWAWTTRCPSWGADVCVFSGRSRKPWGTCRKWIAGWKCCTRMCFPGWGMRRAGRWTLRRESFASKPMAASQSLPADEVERRHRQRTTGNRGTRRSEEVSRSWEKHSSEEIPKCYQSAEWRSRDSLFSCWDVTWGPQTPGGERWPPSFIPNISHWKKALTPQRRFQELKPLTTACARFCILRVAAQLPGRLLAGSWEGTYNAVVLPVFIQIPFGWGY